MTPAMEKKLLETLDRLESVSTLAEANFPRSTALRLETLSVDPRAGMTIHQWELECIIKLARTALTRSNKDDRP